MVVLSLTDWSEVAFQCPRAAWCADTVRLCSTAFATAQTAFQCISPLLPRRHRSDHQVGPESPGFPPQGMSLVGSPSTFAPSSPCCLQTLASSTTSSPTDVCSLSTSFPRSPKPQIRKLPPHCTILHALILFFAHPLLGCPELPCAASTYRLVFPSRRALASCPDACHCAVILQVPTLAESSLSGIPEDARILLNKQAVVVLVEKLPHVAPQFANLNNMVVVGRWGVARTSGDCCAQHQSSTDAADVPACTGV